MQKTINSILRDHGIIDNGVSEVIAQMIEPLIHQTIRNELNLAETASKAMQGMLASRDSSELSDGEIVTCSVNIAADLLSTLEAMRDKKLAH